MAKGFDVAGAKKNLLAREEKEKKQMEADRKATLQKVTSILTDYFKTSTVEVYLIGSILKPFAFSSRSDVDIVLKNYTGDRFQCWAHLEHVIDRNVELFLFETSPFQEFVLKEGFKAL